MDAVMRARPFATASALIWALTGCIGNSPEQQAADALGPDFGQYETGPYHRAGFPCVTCHGGLWWQPTPAFELAGTVYQRSSGGAASRNAAIDIKDASGHAFTARTNSAGNFFVVVAGNQPQQYGDGRSEIPWQLDFPLSVRVRASGADQPMRSRVWKERSCAACHNGTPTAESNGRIFIEEPAQ